MLPMFMNGVSGDWLWPQAWFVALAQIAIFFAAARYVWLHNPGLYTEREQFTGHEDTAAFDKVLATAVVYVTPFLVSCSLWELVLVVCVQNVGSLSCAATWPVWVKQLATASYIRLRVHVM